MEEYRKMLDLFNREDEMSKLEGFTHKLLNSDAEYTAYKESFYRILDGLKKDGIHVYGIKDEKTGHTIEDCLYMMCRDHEAIGVAIGLSLDNFISPSDKKTRAALKALLEKLIENGILQYGPAEMFANELESKPASSPPT